jgi:hypothetical protein
MLALCLAGFEGRAEAMTITSLDFTSGAANFTGKNSQILDRLLAQGGTITMGSYQSMTEIVDPITLGNKTFSLFTSGLNGAPPPSGTVNGSSISVDLSSLFFGWTRGDQVRALNIGGLATGLFNPQTSQFMLSWDHLFSNGIGNERHGRGEHALISNSSNHLATFFLQGTAAPIPLPASLVFFASGLGLLGGFFRRRSGRVPAGASS